MLFDAPFAYIDVLKIKQQKEYHTINEKLLTLALLMLVGIMANAQMLDPVKFSTTLKTNNSTEGEIVFTGKSVVAGMYIARA